MLVQPSLVMATLLTPLSSNTMFDFSTVYQAGINSLLKLSLEGGVYFGFRALVISLQKDIQHKFYNSTWLLLPYYRHTFF